LHVGLKGLMATLYLEDLGDKTHRGLAGRLERGLSAGGRTFGYRSVPLAADAGGKRGQAARVEVNPTEAAIVRRVFQEYAAGRSMKTIAHRLNTDRVAFPAKDTRRGPARLGWAVSTIHVMLRNRKYIGDWTWNRTRFLKEPETGRRRPVERPAHEWVKQDRPDLVIIEPELWAAVQHRFTQVRETFGAHAGPPRGGARALYSRYLLTGLLRCDMCGARMRAQTAVKRRKGHVYRAGWYRCAFAADKGPSVCRHRTWYRQDRLEGALVERFKAAMTPAMIEALTEAVNARLAAAHRDHDDRAGDLKTEILRLECEAGNLVRALREGLDFSTVRAELQAAEDGLSALRLELTQVEGADTEVPPRVHPTWVRKRLGELDRLLRQDLPRARIEIGRHLDGDLTIRPVPPVAGEPGHAFAIVGRLKSDSLLGMNQEAACATLVAGAGFEAATLGL
jgi:hypothetical protein